MSARCPTCRKALAPGVAQAPFCSERCRLADLGAWLAEAYRIPVTPQDDEDGESTAAGEPTDDERD